MTYFLSAITYKPYLCFGLGLDGPSFGVSFIVCPFSSASSLGEI